MLLVTERHGVVNNAEVNLPIWRLKQDSMRLVYGVCVTGGLAIGENDTLAVSRKFFHISHINVAALL